MKPAQKVSEVPLSAGMSAQNRWTIATAGVFMQVALGAVYAWSVFRTPLTKQFGWSISDVTLTFTIAIFALGFAAFFGGLWLNKKGPRVVAMTGGVLYGLGVFLASFSAHRLWWLYLSYGLIGGIGRLHCASGRAGEMVSRPARFDHRDRRGWIWRRCISYRTCGNTFDSIDRRAADFCIPRHRVWPGYGSGRLLHAESTCELEAGWMDA